MRRHLRRSIIYLDGTVREMVGQKGKTYEKLCAMKSNRCFSNDMLDIINGTASTIKKANLTFPYHNSTSNTIFLGTELGGVVLNSSIIVSAKAVRLFYFLRENNEAENDNWLHGFTQVFSNLSDELNKVSTVYYI